MDGAVDRRLRFTIAALLLGQFMGMANVTVVITAIPAILDDLGGTPAAGTWIIAGAMLGNTISSPVWGRLTDRFSPIALLAIVYCGALVFAVLPGVAPTILLLIIARGIQGMFLGGMFSLTGIVFAHIVPPRERGPYIGWMSAISLIGSLVAPFLGGIIVESPLGWHGTLFMIVPFCIACLILLRLGVRLKPGSAERRPIDVGGGLLFAATMATFLVWITFVGKAFEPASWQTAVMVGGAIVGFTALMLVEWRVQAPIIPVRLLGRRVIALSAATNALVAAAGIPLSVLMSVYFQLGRGLSPTVAGLLLVAAAAGTAVSSQIIGRLSTRTGRLRRYMIVGAVILASGLALIAALPPDAPIPAVVAALFVAGFGQGAVGQFVMLAAQNSVSLSDTGVVSAFMTFLGPFGGSISLTVTTALYGASLVVLQAAGASDAEAYATAIPSVFWLTAGFAVVALVMICLLPAIRLRRSLDLEEEKA